MGLRRSGRYCSSFEMFPQAVPLGREGSFLCLPSMPKDGIQSLHVRWPEGQSRQDLRGPGRRVRMRACLGAHACVCAYVSACLHTRVCLSTHTCDTCFSIRPHVRRQELEEVCACVHVCVNMSLRVCACVPACACTRAHLCTLASMHVCLCACVPVRPCVCVCVHADSHGRSGCLRPQRGPCGVCDPEGTVV